MGDRSKDVNQSVGKRIKLLREATELTQAELAKRVNKGESTVRMWELGKSEPDNETLKILADLFNVSADYLLGRDEKSPPAEQESLKVPDSLKPYQFAFFEGMDGLSEESVKDILKYVDYVKSRENKEKK